MPDLVASVSNALAPLGFANVRPAGGAGTQTRRSIVLAAECTEGTVAIKVLLPTVNDAYWLGAFHREGLILEALREVEPVVHALAVNITLKPRVVGDFEIRYHVLEWASHDLQPLLGAVCAHEALSLVKQVCEAIDECHARGIVHRDIKPGNVLISQGRVRLADFGASAFLADPPLDPRGEVARYSWSCNRYHAPLEIHCGAGVERSAALAGDVWSLGAVLFELVSGKRLMAEMFTLEELKRFANLFRRAQPDRGPDVLSETLAHLNAAVSRPRISSPLICECTEALDLCAALYMACTDFQPWARPQSLLPWRQEIDAMLVSAGACTDEYAIRGRARTALEGRIEP